MLPAPGFGHRLTAVLIWNFRTAHMVVWGSQVLDTKQKGLSCRNGSCNPSRSYHWSPHSAASSGLPSCLQPANTPEQHLLGPEPKACHTPFKETLNPLLQNNCPKQEEQRTTSFLHLEKTLFCPPTRSPRVPTQAEREQQGHSPLFMLLFCRVRSASSALGVPCCPG